MRFNDTWRYGGEIDVDWIKQTKFLPNQDRLNQSLWKSISSSYSEINTTKSFMLKGTPIQNVKINDSDDKDTEKTLKNPSDGTQPVS